MGRIEAVHVRSSGVTVQLFHGSARGHSLAPIDLFPSVKWAEENIGRWIVLGDRPGAAKLVPGPNEIISHSVDPKTNELVLRCVLCKAEMGRLPKSITKKGPRTIIDQVKLILQAHLPNFHPEIMEAVK
jgi:hypothetical protein